MAKKKTTTKHLTPEEQEREAVLERARERSRRELEEIVFRDQLAYEARQAEAQQKSA